MAQSSVRCTAAAGGTLSSATQPTITGDFTYFMWVKMNSPQYGTGNDSIVFGFGTTGVNSEGFGIGVLALSNTNLSAFIFKFDTTAFLPVTIATGNSTAWAAVAVRHASGSSDYKISFRHETETVWNSTTITLVTPLTAPGPIFIGTDQFGGEGANDADVREFFCQAANLSDAALLTASQNINTPPAGTNLHFLQLLDAATAATNGGTAANWTVVPTLLTAATEPLETTGASANVIGYHYVTA